MGQFSVEILRSTGGDSPHQKTDPRSFVRASPARLSGRQPVVFCFWRVAPVAAAAVVPSATIAVAATRVAAGHVKLLFQKQQPFLVVQG